MLLPAGSNVGLSSGAGVGLAGGGGACDDSVEDEDLFESRSSWAIEISIDDVSTPAPKPKRLEARRRGSDEKPTTWADGEDDATSGTRAR